MGVEVGSAQDTLMHLLDENARFELNARGTTNHCPMALFALAKMGASPQRLDAFFARWSQKYAIIDTQAGVPIEDGDWLARLGNPAAFGSLRRHFCALIDANGACAVISEVLSQAPYAPATGAFHAIIRTAYGIEAGHAGETAAGLAAYVATSLPVCIELAGRQPALSVEEGFSILSQQFAGRDWDGRSITARLKAIAADPDFEMALRAPPAGPALLDNLARFAIELYWQRADFTVLHMVSGIHAARIVLAQLPAKCADSLALAMWPALCAAYVSAGAPQSIRPAPPHEGDGWPEIFERAIKSDDDHVIKLIYTCSEEARRDPDSAFYLAAASRISRKHD